MSTRTQITWTLSELEVMGAHIRVEWPYSQDLQEICGDGAVFDDDGAIFVPIKLYMERQDELASRKKERETT